MNQHEERVALSRQRVRATVVDLIVERGVHGVTVDEVAVRSKVAKTTIYRHWASREALLADTLVDALPEAVSPGTGSLAGDLRVLARGLAAGLADPVFAALLATIALPDRDPTLDQVRRDATASRHRVLREIVDGARRRGEVIPVDGADGLIRSIAGPLFYRRFVEGVAPTPKMADRCVQRAVASLTDAEFGGGRHRQTT